MNKYNIDLKNIKMEAEMNAEQMEKISQKLYNKPFLELNKKEMKKIVEQFFFKILPPQYLKQSPLTLIQIAKDMEGKYEVFAEKNGDYLTNGKLLLIDNKIVPQLRDKYWKWYKEKRLKQLIRKEQLPEEMLIKEVEREIQQKRYKTKKIPPYKKVIIDVNTILNTYTELINLNVGIYRNTEIVLLLYTDGKEIYGIQKKYIDFFKKYLKKNINIYKPDDLYKPFAVLIGKELKGFVMIWNFDSWEYMYIDYLLKYQLDSSGK